MLSLTLLSAALAADPLADLSRQLDGDGQGPAMMLACSPLDEVLSRLAGAADGPTRAMLPPTVRSWLSMADPTVAQAAGLDPDGGFILTADGTGQPGTGLSLSLPFSGDDAQAEALLPKLMRLQSLDHSPETGGWSIEQEGRIWTAALDEGRLSLDSGAIAAVPVDAGLLQNIPPAPGCAFIGSDVEKLGQRSVLVFIPLAGEPQPIRIRISAPEGLITPPAGSGGPQHAIYTDTTPLAVMVLSIDPLAMMEQAGMEQERGLSAEDIRAIAEKVRILPGTTLAAFGSLRKPTWAMTIPVADRAGKPLKARKLRRGLRASDLELSWSSRTDFSAIDGEQTVHGAIREGQLLLSVDPVLLAETLTDDGEPWVVAGYAEHSAEWPISLRLTKQPLSAHVGAQIREEYLEMSLELPERRGELTRLPAQHAPPQPAPDTPGARFAVRAPAAGLG
ncbi:MAG: hypothetical protein ACI8S6_001537 [Myxococcota bacterium]|jgi:hypothetical protein